MAVPEVLVSGHHGEVERWRGEAALEKTRRNRPDLLEANEEAGMTDRGAVEKWVGRYVRAWSSNDPDEIGGLFTEEAEYYTAPWREPVAGPPGDRRRLARPEGRIRDVVVRVGGPGDRREPGVVRGWTTYTTEGDPDPGPFSNLWVIDLTPEGRASRFVEWWMTETR